MRGATYSRLPGVWGFSLIELLVAIGIGVVLSFGAMNLFLHSKLSYLEDEEMARMQENGRFALRYLSRELAMAGYLATLPPGQAVATGATGSSCFDYLLLSELPLEHVDNATVEGMPGEAGALLPDDCRQAGKHQRGSDILLSRRTLDAPVVFRGEQLQAIDNDAMYLRTGSEGAIPRPENRLERGGADLPAGMDLWEYSPRIIFLRNYSLSIDDNIPTLCRLRLSKAANRMAPVQCLIEGIENLQLTFGIDDDGDRRADRFTPQPGPGELRAAVAARLYLLVRSLHPIPGYVNDKVYTLGTTVIAATGDAYYRRVMQTTVLLRNSGAFGL